MKKIHTLFILDRSGSMKPHRSSVIESINANLATLRTEAKANGIKAFNTLLTFSANAHLWGRPTLKEAEKTDFIFPRLIKEVEEIEDLTDYEYNPNGGTPLLDAIGIGVERLKTELGDELGSDDVSVLVTIFTDGEENESKRYTNGQIKQMIEHLSKDNKWTFTFVGCGSLDDVSETSATLGINTNNTMAFASTERGFATAYAACNTSYTNYIRATSAGAEVKDLFVDKTEEKKV